MSEPPPPLPPSATPPSYQKPSSLAAWLCWVGASTLLPALPFFVLGDKALEGDASVLLVIFAMCMQLVCAIWLSMVLAKRVRQGAGFIIAMSVVFMVGSVAIGTASFFGACVASNAGKSINMH